MIKPSPWQHVQTAASCVFFGEYPIDLLVMYQRVNTEALKGFTINPAKQLSIADIVGMLKISKKTSLVISSKVLRKVLMPENLLAELSVAGT